MDFNYLAKSKMGPPTPVSCSRYETGRSATATTASDSVGVLGEADARQARLAAHYDAFKEFIVGGADGQVKRNRRELPT
jgi:hypothetical protein